MAKTTYLCEKKINEVWENRETRLRQEFRKETAKFCAAKAKQATPNTTNTNTARCAELQEKLKVYTNGIQTLQIRKQDGTLSNTLETEIP